MIAQSFVVPGDGLVNFRVDLDDGDYFTLASTEISALPVDLISLTQNQGKGMYASTGRRLLKRPMPIF